MYRHVHIQELIPWSVFNPKCTQRCSASSLSHITGDQASIYG